MQRAKIALQSKRSYSFTLLELLVALGIIAILGTLVSIQGKDLLTHHRFQTSTQSVVFDLNRYQLLAITQNTDIICKISQQKGSCLVEWFPEGPLPVSNKELSYNCPGIEELLVNGKKVTSTEFTIFSSGRIAPITKLSFLSKKQEKHIDLTYPKYLKNSLSSNSYFSFIPACPKKKNKNSQHSIDK